MSIGVLGALSCMPWLQTPDIAASDGDKGCKSRASGKF